MGRRSSGSLSLVKNFSLLGNVLACICNLNSWILAFIDAPLCYGIGLLELVALCSVSWSKLDGVIGLRASSDIDFRTSRCLKVSDLYYYF